MMLFISDTCGIRIKCFIVWFYPLVILSFTVPTVAITFIYRLLFYNIFGLLLRPWNYVSYYFFHVHCSVAQGTKESHSSRDAKKNCISYETDTV